MQSVDPDALRRQRMRAYDATLAKMVPDLVAPKRAPLTSTDRTEQVTDVTRFAKLSSEAPENGALAGEAVGDVDDIPSAIVDAFIRLYLTELAVPFTAETYELVRITVGFTYGWTRQPAVK